MHYFLTKVAVSIEKFMPNSAAITHQADPIKRARLRWRARRGLLENDLILTRFLDANEDSLTDEEVEAFSRLMEMSDNDLMGLILNRTEPTDEMNEAAVVSLLARIRCA